MVVASAVATLVLLDTNAYPRLVGIGIGVGIVATALWLIKRDGELRNLEAPEYAQGAIEKDVRAAVELGRARASLRESTHKREPDEGLRCVWVGNSLYLPGHLVSLDSVPVQHERSS